MSHQLTLANTIVGFLLPQAIAVANQAKWQPRLKALVAFAACLAAATLTSYAAGQLEPRYWVLSAMTVFVTAQVSYRGLWHPVGITSRIEQKTSPTTGGNARARH